MKLHRLILSSLVFWELVRVCIIVSLGAAALNAEGDPGAGMMLVLLGTGLLVFPALPVFMAMNGKADVAAELYALAKVPAIVVEFLVALFAGGPGLVILSVAEALGGGAGVYRLYLGSTLPAGSAGAAALLVFIDLLAVVLVGTGRKRGEASGMDVRPELSVTRVEEDE